MDSSSRLWPVLLIAVIASGCTYTTVEAPPPREVRTYGPPPPRPLPRRPPPPPLPPPPAAWEKISELSVDGAADRDRLVLGRATDRYRALQFRVTRSPMRMYDVVINFVDGSRFSPATKLVFEPGDTRTIDLPGDVRAIRDIEFRYGDVPGGGRAHVQVWGR